MCSIFKISHIATPVSSANAVEKSALFNSVVRTKIRSPCVIEAIDDLKANHPDDGIAGYEASGWFLLGSEAQVNVRPLMALPTRDAILPMLALLGLSKENNKPVSKLKHSLPKRCTASDRLQNIPTDTSQQTITFLIDNPEAIIDIMLLNATDVLTIDVIDGLRVEFDSGDIIYLRPSGKAPELRCYAEFSDKNNAHE